MQESKQITLVISGEYVFIDDAGTHQEIPAGEEPKAYFANYVNDQLAKGWKVFPIPDHIIEYEKLYINVSTLVRE